MLVELPISIGDVVSVKFSNGDEIIGRVSAIDINTVTISKPLSVMLAQDPRTGNPGVQMVPIWILTADREGKFPINRQHIVSMVKANVDAVKGYTANTSGLTIPSSSAASSLIK